MQPEFSPLVSIVVPTYNRAALISQTINSILGQTYANWEAIIVDDHSTDETVALIKKWSVTDSRIKIFIRDREPKGAPTCRNIGFEKSIGDFVIFLDSDDILAPFCIAQRVAAYKNNPSADFLVFPILMFDKDISDATVLWNVASSEDDLLRFLRIDALWQTMGPIYRKAALVTVGGFREDLPFWQDFDLHLRCLILGLTYKKLFDEIPDSYHRRNYVDSISRTISLVSDRPILQKRIDYYFSLIAFVRQRKIRMRGEYIETIWSVLFFFISSFIIRHKNAGLFTKELIKAKRWLGLKPGKFILSYFYAVLLAISRRIPIFNKICNLYYRLFRSNLPDYKIIYSNNLMGKVKWKDIKS